MDEKQLLAAILEELRGLRFDLEEYKKFQQEQHEAAMKKVNFNLDDLLGKLPPFTRAMLDGAIKK